MRLITGAFVALLVFLDFDFGLAVDTIAPGESVRDGDVLISNGERFAAGFFSPGNSSESYLGIWYNKGSEKTIVWVANRDISIRYKAGVVRIDGGNLVLYQENSNESVVVWSSNVSPVSNDSLAVQLQDSGNLVLFRTQDRSKVVWQSLDYPTNVMLPGLKLGLDRRTGLVRNISSWKSNNDPGKGNVSLGIDPTGSPQLILYKGRDPWWRAGPWMGQRWSGIPEMMATFMFDTTYVNNADELSISFGTSNSSFTYFMVSSEGASVQRVIGDGNDQQLVQAWSAPKDECDRFNSCGANGNCDLYDASSLICRCLPGYEPRSLPDWNSGDGSGGCARTPGALMCQSGEGFVRLGNVKVPDTSMAQADMSLSLKACEEECLNNCSCTAFTSADYDKQIGCLRWFGDLFDTRTYSGIGQDIYIRVDAATLAQEKNKSKKFLTNKKILAIVVTPIAILIIVSIIYWLMKRRRSGLKDFETGELDGSRNLSLPVFGVSTIRAATNEFLPANKLGEGGFGSVYKGRLENGDEIAVKRLSKTSRQGVDEFKTEVRLISKLQHKNLVRIAGCCIHKEEKILVYEFLPNKSLDWFIFDERRSLLDWNRRYEIVLGIARGLLYLHHDSRLKIIHRDLKASNVLLDTAWNPKISDFGMARIFGEDQTEANTNKVVGTYGYMSPEYAMDGLYSTKSDVFSYGVIVLEIISGRKNHHYYEESPSMNLIGLVWELWNEGKAMSIVDSSIQDSYDLQQVSRCIHIGLLCVQECPADRPSMSSIVFMLSNETTLASPNKPAYVLKRGYNIDSSSSASTNNVTMTVMEAR